MIDKHTKQDIKVELVGGLGNQLFGLVFGAAIATRFKKNLVLDKTLIMLGSNSTRKLELHNFAFRYLQFDYAESWLRTEFLSGLPNIVRRIVRKLTWIRKVSLKEQKIASLITKNRTIRFSGSFLDWMYADFLISVLPDFTPRIENISPNLANSLSEMSIDMPIVVHIRTGDYLLHPNVYSLLPEDYYINAIKTIRKKDDFIPVWIVVESQSQTERIYPNLVKLADKIFEGSNQLKDFEVFYLMANAEKLIASNSTFSLWAAWFAINLESNVIVPSEFKISGIPSKLIDDRWDQIDLNTFQFVKKRQLLSIRAENVDRFNKLFD